MGVNWQEIIGALRGESFRVLDQSGDEISLGEKLGGGGTKSVYAACMPDGERSALVLPNMLSYASEMDDRWGKVLREPELTHLIGDRGLLTNEEVELVNITVNGFELVTLKMRPHDELGYQVFLRTALGENSVRDGDQIFSGEQEFWRQFEGVVTDVNLLVGAGISIGRDMVNLAQTEEGLRLFMEDLGGVRMDIERTTQQVNDLTQQCTVFAFDVLVNNLSAENYRECSEMIDLLGDNYFGL